MGPLNALIHGWRGRKWSQPPRRAMWRYVLLSLNVGTTELMVPLLKTQVSKSHTCA